MTSHSSSRNHGGYVYRCISRLQETSHYSSCNRWKRVDFEGRGGYRSLTSHHYSHNQCERGRLLNFKETLLMVMGELDIGTRSATITPKEEILGMSLQDKEVGLKRSTTIPCSTLDKVLTELG